MELRNFIASCNLIKTSMMKIKYIFLNTHLLISIFVFLYFNRKRSIRSTHISYDLKIELIKECEI